jgi:CO/xanthine dehydrogenase Mo-binding subunit
MARAQLQVMGLERGAADVQLPSLLWGWPVLCPLAHAEVLAIDAHEALKDKRVLAVLTAQTPLHEPATRHQALLSSLLSPIGTSSRTGGCLGLGRDATAGS